LADANIGVIIVTFNDIYDTMRIAESVFESGHSGLKILVVDNGSTEAVVRRLSERLTTKFPAVEFLHIDEDRGYGNACNEGAAHFRKRGCNLLLFLNNDVLLDKKSISLLTSYFNEGEVALAGPKVYNGLTDTIYSAGGSFSKFLLLAKNRGSGEPDKGQYDRAEDVEFINGCAFMISTEVFTELGGFDTKFRYYSDESDLCYRILKKGYRTVYEPRAVAYHWPSTTLGCESKRTFYYMVRSRLYFIDKHTRGKAIIICTIGYILLHFILNFGYRRLGSIVTRYCAVARGMLDFALRKSGKGPYG